MLTKRSEAVFRRYFLNQWTEAEEIWEAAALWDDLLGDPRFDPQRKTYVAIDIGRRHDTCAVAYGQYDEDEDLVHVGQKIWQNPHRRNTEEWRNWRMTIADVEEFLRGLFKAFPTATALMEGDDYYRLPGPAFFYDPHFFSRSAEVLSEDGLNMREVPQTDTRMVPASQRLFEVIKTGGLVHDGNPTMRKHIRSVVPKERERGWRIAKLAANKAIDGAIALAMMVYYCTEGIEDGSSQTPNIW